MEDKRTLLAFLFIGLIFLLLPFYNEWMGHTPEPLGDSQEAPVAHAITNLQLDSTITSVASTYLIYVYQQYVSMRAAIVAI